MQLNMFGDKPKVKKGYKYCRDCDTTKPVSEFYPKYDTKVKGKFLSYCIDCHKERAKISRLGGVRTPKHEIKLLMELKKNGVHALSGTDFNIYPFVDIVCWGCVRIEARASRLHSDHRYNFKIGKVDRKIPHSDLICLICDNGEQSTFHLFELNHPVFFDNNQYKTGVSYMPDKYAKHRKNKLYLGDYLMSQHLDNWDLIEQKRIEISEGLKATS